MAAVKYIITLSGHTGDKTFNKLKQEEKQDAEYDLLVSFCKGEIGFSKTLYYDNNRLIKNPNTNLPNFILMNILDKNGLGWLLHSQFQNKMDEYRHRNKIIKNFIRNAKYQHMSRIKFIGLPIGTFCTFDLIMNIQTIYDGPNTPIQKRELVRLFGKLYTHGTDGYQDNWLYATDFNTGKVIKTSSAGDEKYNIRRNMINNYLINNHKLNLTLPLKIYFKNVNRTGKWPVDLTDDILWPETRSDVRKFFHNVPTMDELYYYGW